MLTERLDPRFSQPRTLVFGVGAQKSATSWLDRYLREHPQVCLPVRKEQHYWTSRRLPGAPDRLPRVDAKLRRIEAMSFIARLTRAPKRCEGDRAWALTDAMLRDRSDQHGAYADVLFQTYRGEPVVGEITPAYALLGAAAFQEMASLAGDVRFVFVMRDPVERLLSGARQSAIKRRIRDGVVGEGMAERLQGALRNPQDPDLLKSRYDLTVQRLESVVPRERVCYLFFETLFRQEEIDRLTGFLGIEPRAATIERKVNASDARADRMFEDAENDAREVLAPVYDFVRSRFGAQVPAAWSAPAAAPR